MIGISLFSNCGAGDVGYRRSGIDFDVMAELKANRLAVAILNHPGATGVVGDLRTTWPQVVSTYQSLRGDTTPDFLAACPPCQGISSARGLRGAGNDPDAGSRDARNLLVAVIAEVVNSLHPKILVVENVPAFLTRQIRDPLSGESVSAARWLIQRLASEYAAYPVLVDLSHFGVPQTRKRTFITFIHRGLPGLAQLIQHQLAPYPQPHTAPDYNGRSISLAEALESYNLPTLDSRSVQEAHSNIELHFVPSYNEMRYRMIEAIPPDSGATAWENDRCIRCDSLVSDRDRAYCLECGTPLPRPLHNVNGEYRLIQGFRSTSYKRMSPDIPAATITTATGHLGSHTTIHPNQNRVLSPLECAKLQTFPDDFQWGNTLAEYGHTNIRAMIGEAVPPVFTENHGRVLNQILLNEPIDQVMPQTDLRVRHAHAKLGI